jgi:alpha-ketoglutarate-dependent taurine dioxygenase
MDVSEFGTDVLGWAERNSEQIEAALLESGALLFRKTGLDSPQKFESFARLTSSELPDFTEESSPRSRVAGQVMTSTDYPGRYSIQFHNEYSYAASWPLKLYFCCLHPPEVGGATPIADTRAILSRMSYATRDTFEKKGVLYVRNYRPDAGVSWQTAFATSDPNRVAQICRASHIEYEWRSGDVLHTRQYGQAIVLHPKTREPAWFNHGFFFNVRAVEPPAARTALLAYPPEDPYSTNALFGDGTPISAGIIEELRGLYQAAAVPVPWERGDVLLIDNMLSSHGRAPFKGQRRIVVIMADRVSRSQLSAIGGDTPTR